MRVIDSKVSKTYAESIAWTEFLQARWAFKCQVPVLSMNVLDYALNLHNFGPDLRGMSPGVHRDSRTPAVAHRRSKTNRRSHKKGARGESPNVRCNAYTFYVRKRFRAAEAEGQNQKSSDVISMISREWNSMSSSEKDAVKLEWKAYLAEVGEIRT